MINDLESAVYSYSPSFPVSKYLLCTWMPAENEALDFNISPPPPPDPPPANQQHKLYLSFFEGMALQLPVVSY